MDPNIKVINLEASDKKTSQHFKKILVQRNLKSFHYGGAKNTQSNTIRLNEDDYSKPTKTITDLIQTREAIDEKLRNYTEVDNNELELLPKNVHICYITYNVEKNMELFRMGGYLKKVAKDYIVLAGKGNKTFSVQRKIYSNKDKSQLLYVTRFFAKKKNSTSYSKLTVGGAQYNREAIKKEYEETLTKSTSFIKNQQEILEAKQREIAELRARLEEEKSKSKKKDELAPIKSIVERENLKVYNHIDNDSESVFSNKSSKSNVSNMSNVSNKSSKSILSNSSSKSNISSKK